MRTMLFRRRNKRLSPRQVEEIVQEYLDQFERESEEGKAKEKKARREASRRRSSKRHASQATRSSLNARASESLATEALTASGQGSAKQIAEKNSASPEPAAPVATAATFGFDSESPIPQSSKETAAANEFKNKSSGTVANASVGRVTATPSGRTLSDREEPAVQGYQE